MIGQYIQNYEITAHLGEGGMGVVYKANDTILGREVALKMLHTPLINQAQFLERFKKEARILAQLLHPNIAVIYNFIEQDGRYYMVMEYVDGENLDSILRTSKTIGYKAVVAMMYHALEGLHHAHRKNICHRDIKPSNLILTNEQELKLMDFGIAKIAGEQKLTQVARVIGTLEYMAPEIIAGKEPAAASDIYALGVTMYELLTGRLPFENKTDYTLMQDIVKKDPVSPEKLNPAIPKPLADIIKKAVQKKPEDRYPDARSFQQALMTAFPGNSKINASEIIKQAPVTRLAAIPGGHIPGAATVLQEVPVMKPVHALLTRIRQVPRLQLMIISGILLAFTVFAAFSGVFGKRPEIQELTVKMRSATDSGKQSQHISTGAFPSPAPPPQASPVIARVETGEKLLPADGPIDVPDNQTNNTTNNKINNKIPSSPGLKRTSNKSSSSSTDNTSSTGSSGSQSSSLSEKEVAHDQREEKAPVKKQLITLDNRIRVVLILSENINADYAREGQKFKLEVQRPVVYEGKTIISQGARAEGTITEINKRKTIIVMSSVEASNGEKIYFEAEDIAGKGGKVFERKHYIGIIKKGLTLAF